MRTLSQTTVNRRSLELSGAIGTQKHVQAAKSLCVCFSLKALGWDSITAMDSSQVTARIAISITTARFNGHILDILTRRVMTQGGNSGCF